MSAASPVALATTFLFVPASRPDRFARALGSGAGVVVIDLEDAVAPSGRDQARDALASAFAAIAPADRGRVLVRINDARSRWHADDVRAAGRLVASGLAGVMLPKAAVAGDLAQLVLALGPRASLVALIESGAGLDALEAIAAVPGLTRLAFGHLDFMADLGMSCGEDESALLPARFAMVRASRRAGLAPPVDGVTAAVQDAPCVARDAQRSLRLGFGGKLCIHPAQIAPAREAFTPAPAEIQWARQVAQRADAGESLFLLDGRMVDAPLVALARRVLQRAPPPRGPRFQPPAGASRRGTGDSEAKVSPRI